MTGTLHINAQCFDQLNNAMGITISQSAIDEIEIMACDLIDSLPQGLSDSFKIFSVSAYSLRNFYGSDHLDFEQRVTDLADLSSPYYLLLFQKVNAGGVIDIASAKLKLPKTGQFICDKFDETIWEYQFSEELSKNLIGNALIENNFVTAYKKILSNFKYKVAQFNDCCGDSRSSCTACISSDEVKAYLLGKEFVGIKCPPFQNVTKLVNSSVIDSASVGFGTSNIGIEALDIVQIWRQKYSKPNSKVYISKNSTFCNMAAIRSLDSIYRIDSLDYDIWVHAFVDDDSGDNFLFIRFQYYMAIDNPEYGDYYDPDLPSIINNQTSGSRSSAASFLNYDPESGSFNICDTIPLLKFNFPETTGLSELLLHTVTNGENFISIVNLYGNTFTVEDLQNWNPSLNGNSLVSGQKVSLFFDDVQDQIDNENGYYPTVIPLNAPKTLHDVDIPIFELKKGLLKMPPLVIYPDVPPNMFPIKIDPFTPIKHWFTKYSPSPKVLNAIKHGGVIIGAYLLTSYGANAFNLEFLQSEEEKLEPNDKGMRLTYVTYTKQRLLAVNKPHLPIGKVYIGRSSGFGNPKNIVKIRNYSHHKNNQLYTNYGCLDEWAYAFNKFDQRKEDVSYMFIRGREQNVIEALNEAWSFWALRFSQGEVGPDYIMYTRSGNAINGMVKNTPYYKSCTELAERFSENPSLDWNGSTNCQN